MITTNLIEIISSRIILTEKVQGHKDELVTSLVNQLAEKLLQKIIAYQTLQAPANVPAPAPVAAVPIPENQTLKNYFGTTQAMSHFYQASYYLDLKKPDLAVKEYQQAITIDPQFTAAYINLGVVYLQQNQFDLARTSFMQAIGIDENFELGHYNLGLYFGTVGQIENAIHEFTRAIEINPNNPEIFVELGKAYYKMSNFAQAKQAFEQALRLDQNFVAANYYLGIALKKENLSEPARLEWEKVVHSQEPYFKDVRQLAYMQLAELFLMQNQAEMALNYFQNSLLIEKNIPNTETHARILSGMGKACLQLRQFAQATEKFEAAVQLLPQNAELHLLNGISMIQTGNTARAKTELQLALDLSTSNAIKEQAKIYLARLAD